MKRPLAVHAAILGTFCLGFGVVLAVTHHLTADDIAARLMEDRQSSLDRVIPSQAHDNDLLADTLTVRDDDGQDLTVYRGTRDGKVTAVAYEIRATGYAGAIKLMLGVAADGEVLGVRVLAHKETPGLGDKIDENKDDWISRFTGLGLGHPPTEQWKVKKDGGVFDQFTGATITPRGVVTAVRNGLSFYAAHQAQLTEVR